jgi:hypothetical protein
MTDIGLLHPIVNTAQGLVRESRKRKDVFDHQSVPTGSEDTYLANGWEFEKQLKTKVKLRKQKKIDEIHENRCWLLLHLLDYQELNEGRKFSIEIKRKGAENIRKQIDIFAKDDETIIIGECKASNKLTKRSLQKDIEEFANLKGPISKSIKKQYGNTYKPKIIWVFFTHNIIWSRPDAVDFPQFHRHSKVTI